MIRVVAQLLLLFVFGASSFAAPSVTGVTGTISNGQSVTISGTDFGATGPTVVLFDDFEDGTSGNAIPTGSGSAVIGQWSDITALGHPTGHYSSAESRSGSLSYGLIFDNDDTYEQIGLQLSDISDFMLCYWVSIGTVPAVPDGANFKMAWLLDNTLGNIASSDHTIPTAITSLPITRLFVGSDDSQMWDYVDGEWTCPSWSTDTWRRFCCHIHGHASSGSIKMWETTGSGTSLVINASSIATKRASSVWKMLTLPGYGRADSNGSAWYDDIYVASGSGAAARVEICNNATYTSATNCAIATPTSWGATSITATVRQGSFGASDNAYLFVIDSSGAASSGYAVQFGAGGETPAARKLQNVTGNRVSLH